MNATPRAQAVAIDIMGMTYHVRSDEDEQYIRELAEIVNAKMREIHHQTATVDSLKCAVLAALNLADDLCKLNKEYRSYRGLTQNQHSRMIRIIDGALQSEASGDKNPCPSGDGEHN